MPDIKPFIGAVGGIAAAIALIVPFIQQREGHASHVYKDVGGILTVCYGHTGSDIVPKHVYTNTECKALQIKDIKKAANGILQTNPDLIDHTYILAATISFTYNVGINTYQQSSVSRDFKAGNFKLGCSDMLKYVYAGHKYSRGLDNRRHAEYNICMKGV